jgi:hypothetical protein
VVALPINPAMDESNTIARLLPMAILVGIRTNEVISGMRMNDPPWPINPPSNPTVEAEVTARHRENVRHLTLGFSHSPFTGINIKKAALKARPAKIKSKIWFGT